MITKLISSETIKGMSFADDVKKDAVQFLDENLELVTGVPADWIAGALESTLADDKYAEAMVEAYRAMSTEERNRFNARNLKTLANSREVLTRRMVLMQRAKTMVTQSVRKALAAAFAAL